MISEIKIGDKVKCLRCGSVIEINEDTFKLTAECEKVICESCGFSCDVQLYHFYGEKAK